MKRRLGRTAALAVVVTLLATSCGAGDAQPGTDDAAEGEDSTATPTAGPDGEGSSGLGLSADEPTVIRANELAVVMIEQFGDDATAVGVLLLAGDAGYDAPQIEAAIVGGDLTTAGLITGVDPNLGGYGKIAGLQAPDEEPLPIEQLRQEAIEEAGREDFSAVGGLATALILQWQLSGYSQEQIVDMLILGVEVLDGRYEGVIAEGEEECGGYVIGGVHEIPQFCDPETGELYADSDDLEPAAAPEDAPTTGAGPTGLCGGSFAPPYTAVPIEAAGVMLETEVLGPLNTPYYYTEVNGFLDINNDGTLVLTADTVRYADITIRGAPDNQIYVRSLEASGAIDAQTGDGELTGTGTGTDQLWSDDSERPASGEVSGQLTVLCDDAESSGFAIYGFLGGPGGLLEFEARP